VTAMGQIKQERERDENDDWTQVRTEVRVGNRARGSAGGSRRRLWQLRRFVEQQLRYECVIVRI